MFGWPNVKDDINIHGALSMAIPGYIHGISTALKNFGSMSWKDIIEPACILSKRGLKADWYTTMRINLEAKLLSKYKSSKNIFFEDLEIEKEWMADNIYNGHFQGKVVEIKLTDKYKS